MSAISTESTVQSTLSPAEMREKKDRRRAITLLTPGLLWMTLFMVLPMAMVIYVSF